MTRIISGKSGKSSNTDQKMIPRHIWFISPERFMKMTISQKEANSDRFLTKKGCGRIRILLDLFCTDYLIASNAASRAAIRSFTFSVPMERRIVFGLMP